MNEKMVKALFILAGIYDGFLGFLFFFYSGQIFNLHEVTPPNHVAYVQFPALLLIIFALMFFRVATNPVKYRELILYGCGLKLSYSGLAFWHELTSGIPSMWMPWAWGDLVFLILFIFAWQSLGRQDPKREAG